jgi:hypothetical protein
MWFGRAAADGGWACLYENSPGADGTRDDGHDRGLPAVAPCDHTDLDPDNDRAGRAPFVLDGNARFIDDPPPSDMRLPGPPAYVGIMSRGPFELQRCQFTFVETFEDSLNTGRWTYGGPHGFIDPAGGNPGAFFHDPGLLSVAPHPITTRDSIFTGNYRAMDVLSLGIDLVVFYAEYSADNRPFSLVLITDNRTPDDDSDDWGVYYVGDQNIPPIGAGWVSYEFGIPSQATSLPEGWDFIRLGPEAPAQMNWNDAIVNVTHVMYCYGDPSMCYILQGWDTGFDNPRIALARIPGDLDFDGDVDLRDLTLLLAHYGIPSGATYTDGDLDGDGDVDLSDLAALLATYGTTCG